MSVVACLLMSHMRVPGSLSMGAVKEEEERGKKLASGVELKPDDDDVK